MVKATVTEEQDRTIPEDTLVKAMLAEVDTKMIEWKDRKTGQDKSAELLVWWFEVTDTRFDELYKGRKVKAECRNELTNHPDNEFRLISEALLGRELPTGAGIDTDEDLVGLTCMIEVKHREYEKDGKKKIAEEIAQVFPASVGDDVPFDLG